MAPNLLHIVTGLQHEVQDGTGFEPPVALPLHNMGTITKPIRESAMSTKAMQRQKTFSNGHDLRTQIVYSAATHYITVHILWLVVSAFRLPYGIASLH